jgi:ABC-2 type transport system ATP-binding protein
MFPKNSAFLFHTIYNITLKPARAGFCNVNTIKCYNTYMNSVIQVQNLKKTYNLSRANEKGEKTFEAVKGTSFEVYKGEIFGILGPNGAGKTTTLEIIEGVKTQTDGTITVLGFDNITEAAQIKQCIGVQLQTSGYLPSLTLGELLVLFGSLYQAKVNPKKLLSLVDLEEKEHEYVENLSGGQKQRFTIATSLVHNPEILILDEPTTGLDPHARRQLWELIKKLNADGMTIVLTTHYMEEAEFLCHRVAIMDQGTLLTINEPQKLIEDLVHNTQVSFLTTQSINADIFKDIPGIEKIYNQNPKIILEIKSLDHIAKIVETLKRSNIRFSGFTVRTASLEDVYLDLTGREYEE